MNTAVCSDVYSNVYSKMNCDAPVYPSEWRFERRSKVARSLAFAGKTWKTKEKDVVTIISPFEEKYEKAKRRIIKLCANQIEVNAPNQNVQRSTLQTLRLLKEKNVLPSLINSTGDESLLFEFFIKADSYSIDFYNSGEIVYLRRVEGQIANGGEINFEQLERAVSEIASAYDGTIL